MESHSIDEQLASGVSTEKPKQTLKLLELIDELREISEFEGEFNFSILIEQNPIDRNFTYVCKVLAIILKESKTTKFIHYDKVCEHGLNYVEIKKKRQKIGIKTPSFIDGNSTVKKFKDNDYIEYNYRLPNNKDLLAINSIRKKYNIPAPYTFNSEKLHFDEI